MDEDGDDSSLSRRDKDLLRQALYATDETPDLNADDLGFDSECDWTPAPDEDPNMLSESPETSPTREIKRPRLAIGSAQSVQQPQPGPSHSRDILITADEEMSFIEEDIIPVPEVSQVLHSEPLHQNVPTHQLRERGDVQLESEPIIMETDVFSVAPVSPSLDRASPSPLGSPETLFTEPIMDSSCDEIVCDFGPDYFHSYYNDDEDDSGAVCSDAYELNDYMEALQLSDEESSPEEDTPKESRRDTEIPLYKNAPISQWESITSILSFVQSEHLSAAALGRLLSLIYLHLPKPNNFLKTKARFLKVMEQYDEPVHIHYFCSICYKIRKNSSELCDKCTDDSKSVLFFITFPLATQLRKMFERQGFVDDLKYKDRRQKENVNNIEDLYDGEVYKEAEKQFLEFCINITLTWNTDGMQIFNSNSFSLWPFYLVINELPPQKRFLSENLLVAGVWGSVVKPHPNVYLLPIFKELKKLQEGIDVKCYGEEETQKVVARTICGTCDAPARASFMNMKQHSGFYSCPVCLVRGEKPGESTVFPYEENFTLRTTPQYKEHVKWAVEKKVILTKVPKHEEKWCGIKGPTILSEIVPDIFTSTAIDAMHCVDLGVVRQMLHLWSHKDYKEKPFSLFKKLKSVNRKLRNLNPPHYLQRLPQTLDKLIYWKATELRSFLFNFSLIILHGELDPVYYQHWSLFVRGMALLNSSSISEEDLVLSSLLLNQFVSQFSTLYGSEHMSHNLHMTLHLERCVRFLGPLWVVTCYEFEDINGRIANYIHGTCHVGLQVHSNLSTVTKLPLMVHSLREGEAKEFCVSILRKRHKLKFKEKIFSGLYCVGTLRGVCASNSWIVDLLVSQNIVSAESSVHLFSRLLKQNMLFVAKSYKRGNRVSSYVKYMKDNQVLYGNIEDFVRVTTCSCPVQHLAIIRKMSVLPTVHGIDVPHMFTHKCNDNNNFNVVQINDVQTVLFKINGTGEIFLSKPLNNFQLK